MNLHDFLPKTSFSAVLAASFLLSGCAVMRVDVDVYKGPLANDEVVQLQQFQSMAPGMFEVMVQLRDQFQWGELPIWQCEDDGQKMRYDVETNFGNKKEETADCPPGYQRRAMPSNAVFTHPKAVQVNAILSLFEDQSPKPLSRLHQAMHTSLPIYDAALMILEPQSSDSIRWTKYEAAMLTAEQFEKRAIVPQGKSGKVKDAYNLFKERFQRLLNPQNALCQVEEQPCRWRNWRSTNVYLKEEATHHGLEEAYNKLRVSLDLDKIGFEGKSNKARFRRLFSEIPEDLSDSTQPTEFFKSARPNRAAKDQRPSWANHYADILFGVKTQADFLNIFFPPREKRLFVKSVTEIGKSYHQARQALRSIWLAGVDALIAVGNPSDPRLERPDLKDKLSDLLSRITNPRKLAVALINPEADMKSKVDLIEAIEKLNKINAATASPVFQLNANPRDNLWVKKTYTDSADVLKELLENHPTRVALLLKSLDRDLKNLNNPKNNNTDVFSDLKPQLLDRSILYNYSRNEARQYGIVRGASIDSDVLGASLTSEEISNFLGAAFAGGLGRGRPEKGVFSLVEDFIEAEQIHRRCKDRPCAADKKRDAEIARDELTQGLIHFAQKVSSIANHDALLPNAGDSNSSSGKTGNLKFAKTSARVRTAFVPTLQAISNTFLIQADELEARRRHTEKLNNRRGAERLALEYSLSRTPAQVIDDLILDLDRRRDAIASGQSSSFATLKSTQDALLKEEEKLANENKKLENLKALLETQSNALKAANEKAAPTIFAYQTLVGKLDKVNSTFNTSETVNDLTADKNKIDAHLSKAGTQVSIDELKTQIIAWLQGDTGTGLQGQIVPKFSDAPRQKRLLKTLEFLLSELGGLAGTNQIPRADAIKKLRDTVENIYNSALPSVNNATSALNATKGKLSTLETDTIPALQKIIGQIVDAEITRLKNTIAVINERRLWVQFRAERPGEDSDPPAVFRLLKDKIKDDFNATEPSAANTTAEQKKASEKTRLSNAQAVLALYPLPSGQTQIAALPDRSMKGDQRDVLDDLIATLHYVDIEAERSGQGARAQAVQAALKKAYEYRAGMVYIRPASSYLRSSYAANSIQGDPTLGWRNMLSRQANRVLPFFIGEALNRDDPDIEEIRAELDKQFWQNINSVRVGGGGNTNYALIKDDIGNWAVKSFSANPEPIIKAAQSLAMFNLGGALDTNLLRVNELRGKPNLNDGEQQELNLLTERSTGGSPAMKRLFEHHEKRYIEGTATQYTAFGTAISGEKLQDRIKAAWKQSIQRDEALQATITAIADKDDELLNAQKNLDNQLQPPKFETKGTAESVEKNRQERRRIAETMGDKMIAAIKNLNLYRSTLVSQAGSALNVNKPKDKVAELTTALQIAEQNLAIHSVKIGQLNSSIADLKVILAAAEEGQKARIDESIVSKEKELKAEQDGVTEVEGTIKMLKSDLEKAEIKLALHQSRLNAVLGDANRILGALIVDIMNKRNQAISDFEQAILFIGDTPDPANDPVAGLPQAPPSPLPGELGNPRE